mmetsp:Transcript_5660/g.17390  ORF Transcript_5660/g.17390 Transcript_5660/m.17390 type:complete len:82 (-) Transcript_5660:159-404(-)
MSGVSPRRLPPMTDHLAVNRRMRPWDSSPYSLLLLGHAHGPANGMVLLEMVQCSAKVKACVARRVISDWLTPKPLHLCVSS